MRSLKTLYILVALALTFGLSCSELPETFRLSDDASNDFVLDSGAARSGNVAVAPISKLLPTETWPAGLTKAVPVFADLSIVLTPEFTPASGTDLLRLVSIQRT
jgi:hypothetical protein